MATDREAHRSHSPAIRNFFPGSYEQERVSWQTLRNLWTIPSGEPHRSNWSYAFGKRLIDALTQAYNFQYGYKWTAVIPCNVYGPYDNFSLKSSHVIPGLIHKCYIAKLEGTPLVVAGSGNPLRQFIYSYDLARLYIWALREYSDTEPIILSTGPNEEVRISEAVTAVAKALDFKGEIMYDRTKADGIYRKGSPINCVTLPQGNSLSYRKSLGGNF